MTCAYCGDKHEWNNENFVCGWPCYAICTACCTKMYPPKPPPGASLWSRIKGWFR